MRSTRLTDLSNEQVVKRRNLLKGIVIGFCTMTVVSIAIVVYLYNNQRLKNVSIATLIPIFALPITLMPAFSSLVMTNKEIKARGLK